MKQFFRSGYLLQGLVKLIARYKSIEYNINKGYQNEKN